VQLAYLLLSIHHFSFTVPIMYRVHKKLEAWQDAMKLTTSVYTVTEKFPKGELFGLVSQMSRAAVSVPSNIAEGAARSSTKEFLQFLNIAGGSLSELDTQVEISMNLDFINSEQKRDLDMMTISISKKLAGLIATRGENWKA
jgi:four helix bundle protein